MDLVNRITVKKDGVYLSSRDSEERQQYRSHISESLTKVFMEGGQRALDQKIFEMLDCMEIETRGNHASVRRYEDTFSSPEGQEILDDCRVKWEACFDQLSEETKRQRNLGRVTPELEKYYAELDKFHQIMYRQLSEICPSVKEKERGEKLRGT
nr:hypothetical protein [uncultured Blautia sp.]